MLVVHARTTSHVTTVDLLIGCTVFKALATAAAASTQELECCAGETAVERASAAVLLSALLPARLQVIYTQGEYSARKAW